MKRLTPLLIGVLSLVGWLGAMFLISRFSESGTQRVSAVLVEPPPGETLRAGENGRVTVRWQLRGTRECAVSLGDREPVPLEDNGSANVVVSPDDVRSVMLTLTCDGKVVGRYARSLASAVGSDSDDVAQGAGDVAESEIGDRQGRIEVARVHVDADELERVLSDRLPAALNPILARELRALAPVVEAESRSWPIPGWLVDGVQLKPTSTVVVRAARLELGESRFSVALDVDVDLDLAILNRPVFAPARRGTRTIDFSIQDRFRPVRATLSLDDWPTLRVHGVKLEGTYCRRFNRDIVSNVCNRAAAKVYGRIESVIEAEVRSAASGLIRSLDLESLLTDAVRRWAASMQLGALADGLIDDAKFELDRTNQDDRGLHASLTTTTGWLSNHGAVHVVETPSTLDVDDSPATIDFAVHVGIFNLLLAELFDRPLVEVANALGEAGAKYGTGEGLGTLEQFLEEGAASDLTEADDRLFVLLRLASMRVYPGAQAQPWLYVTPGGAMALDTGSVDLFESVSRETRLSIQSVAEFSIDEDDEWIVLRGPDEGLSSTLALEPRQLVETEAAEKATRRAEAAVRVFYRTLSAPTSEQELAEDSDSLSSWLGSSTAAPLFPTSYTMGLWRAELRELEFRHTSQSIEMRLEMMTDGSE